MKEQIKKLEEQVAELKAAYEKEEKEKYENQEHRDFLKGDIVTDGTNVGIVDWTENMAINCPHKRGYMGVHIISGRRGFAAPCKRDEWMHVDDPYYTTKHILKLELTGLELEELKYSLGYRNVNPNNTKTLLLDILTSMHRPLDFCKR